MNNEASKEIWLPVAGYESRYEVSNKGRVRSIEDLSVLQQYDGNGYLNVSLYDGSERKKYRAHRLVATAFIPNPNNKPQVNHIDGTRDNNCVENLEWATASENTKHAVDLKGWERTKERIAAIRNIGKARNKPVRCIEDNLVFDSVVEAAKYYGIKTKRLIRASIKEIKKKKSKTLEYVMTPYQSKLKDTLIETGKAVEKAQQLPPPTIPELEVAYDKFLSAVDSGNLSKQAKASRELIAALVKWQVETL